MRRSRTLLACGALCLASLGAAAAGVVAHASAQKATVTVTEREFRIALSTRVAKAGVVRLVVRNAGKYPHSLAIKGTSLRTKRTPTIEPGRSAVLTLALRSGAYTVWCPVPGHAARGMRATLAVTAAAAGSTGSTTAPTTTGATTTDPDEPPGY